MRIVFATANKGKLREAQEILGPDFEVVSPAELGIDADIEETGDTLQENSLLKANYIYEHTRMDCFADDSGLEVDALGGAPGVHTARYAAMLAEERGLPAAPSHDFDANIDTLLSELDRVGATSRRGRFKTCITLIVGGEVHVFNGTMEGSIATSKAGCGGFGYDPVFVADDEPGHTLAEIPEERKNEISHRGKSLRLMAAFLLEK